MDLPIIDEFEQTVDAFIVNLSIDQFWDAFLADDAPFFVWANFWNKEEYEGKITLANLTDWYEPLEEKFESSFGKTVLE